MRLLAALFVVSSVACRVDPPPTSEGIGLCNTDGDCAPGYLCNDDDGVRGATAGDASGICIPERSCGPTNGCPMGMFCFQEAGVCRLRGEATFECAIGEPCPTDKRCVLLSWEALCGPEDDCARVAPLVGCVKFCNNGMCGTDKEVCLKVQAPNGDPSDFVCAPCPAGCSPCNGVVDTRLFFEATSCL